MSPNQCFFKSSAILRGFFGMEANPCLAYHLTRSSFIA